MISALALTVCLALGMTTGSFASPVSEEGAAYTTGVASVDQHMDTAAKARAKAAKASKKDGKMKKDQSGKTEAATPGTTSTAARLTAVASVPRSAKPAGARGVMRNYNPVTDAAPAEPMAIKETHFQFRETLLLRPKTDMIVIHHVGIPDGDTSAAAIHRAHLANGWAGIGYHYVIRKDGTIERGRPLATVGAHAEGQNYHTVGINVTGNFEKEIPTPAQIHSLEGLVAWICKTYSIVPGPSTIVGHRDVNSTDCPGRNLYSLLPQIRKDVAQKMNGMDSSYEDKLKKTNFLKMSRKEREAIIMQGASVF